MQDGDHPDVIVVTYGRCNAALELVEDLCRLIHVSKWAELSLRMLDRDVLADDEWWMSLARRRSRANGRGDNPSLPSYATRVTAGHLLQAAVVGRGYGGGMPDGPLPPQPDGTEWVYDDARREAWVRSGGRCQADGLHHRLCPGHVDRADNPSTFITHHIYPRAQGRRDGVPQGIVDDPANLLVVWNGHTGLGAGGCHGRIHTERTAARKRGLLASKLLTD